MITWLNKELNNKQSSAASGLYSASSASAFVNKPPIGSSIGGSSILGSQFKPSISAIE